MGGKSGVSGLVGLGMGYFGSVALLLIVYFAIFFRGAGRCSIEMIGKEF